MAGIAITKSGVVSTGGASEELVEQIDSFQYASGSGPCLSCMEESRIVRVGSTSKEKRWKTFSSSAASKGIESVLSAPLLLRGNPVGSLNLYGRRADAFSSADETDVGMFARQASVTLANARSLDVCRKTGKGLRRQLDECDLVGRAAGVIMERDQLTGREAHVSLRRSAAKEGMTLEATARQILDDPQSPSLN